MDINEHYPHRTVTLLPGDTIWATYKQPKESTFSPTTLKRLFGWVSGQRYIGRVRRAAPTQGNPDENTLVVDLYEGEKRGRYQCTHFVYNIELQIAKGELTGLRYTPNPYLTLFDDER